MPRLDAGNELADTLKGSAYAPEVYEYDKTAELATAEKPAACATTVRPVMVHAADAVVPAEACCAKMMAALVPRDRHEGGSTIVVAPTNAVGTVEKNVIAGLPGVYVDAAAAQPMSSSEPAVTPEAAAPPGVNVIDMPLENDAPPVMGTAASCQAWTAAGRVKEEVVPVGGAHAVAPAAWHANTGAPKVVTGVYAGPVDA